VLLAGAGAWLESAPVQRRLQGLVNRRIAGTLSWENAHLTLLLGRVSVEGLRLEDLQGRELVRADAAVLRLDPAPLLRGRVRADLHLQSPRVALRRDPSGSVDLLEALAPPSGTPPPAPAPPREDWPAWLAGVALSIEGGAVTWDDPAAPLRHLSLAGILLEAHADPRARRGDLRLRLDAPRAAIGDADLPPASLDLAARLEGDRLTIPRAHFQTAASRLEGSGAARLQGPASEIEADLRLALEAAEWHPLLPPAARATGRIELAGHLAGTPAQPRFTARIQLTDLVRPPWEVPQGLIQLELADGRLRIENTELHTAGGRLALEGDLDVGAALPEGVAGPFRPEALAYRLELQGRELDLAHVPPGAGLPSGRVDFQTQVEGRGVAADGRRLAAGLELAWTAHLPEATAEAVAVRFSADALLEGERLTVSRAQLTAPGARASVQGELDLGRATVAARLEAAVEDASRLPWPPSLGPVRGRLDLQGEAAGDLARPAVALRATATDLAAAGWDLDRLELEGALAPDGRLELRQVKAARDAARLEASAGITLGTAAGPFHPDLRSPLRLEARITDLELQGLPLDLPLAGRTSARLDLSGSVLDPAGTLRLDAAGLVWDGWDLGNLAARLTTRAGALAVESLRLRRDASDVALTGRLDLWSPAAGSWIPDPALDLALQAQPLDLAALDPRAAGLLQVEGRMTGTFHHPRGEARLEGAGLSFAGQPVARLSARLHLEGRRLELAALEADVAPGETLQASGWLGVDRAFALEVDGRDIDLRHLAGIGTQERLQGKLQGRLTGSGTLADPQLEGRLALTGARLDDRPLEPLSAELRLEGRQLTVTGRPGFDLAATADLGSGDLELSARFDATDLTPLAILGGLPDLSGTLSGELSGRGNLRRPEGLTARLAVSELEARLGGRALLEARDLQASLADGVLRVPPAQIRVGDAGRLTMEAAGRWGGSVDARVDGRLPASWLAQWVAADLDPQGMVAVTGRLEGPLADPQPRLELDLESVGFDLPQLDQRVHGLEGRLRLDRGRLRLEDLRGRIADGAFTLRGTLEGITTAGPAGLDLALAARAIPLSLPDTLDVLLDADLRLQGAPADAWLRGDVRLLEGLYYKDVRLRPLEQLERLVRGEQEPPPPPAAPADPRLAGLRLDVAVTRREPLRVENNLAEFGLAPDLRLTGTAARPVLTGRAEVVDGHLTYQKRRFEIRRGVVEFADPYRTAPVLEIRGAVEVRRWQIFLDVTGPPEALDFRLSSEPPEPHEDLLALLLVGQTTAELIGREGGTTRSTEQMLAELAAAALEDDLRRTTGLDVLEVEAGSGEWAADATQLSVTVGKELSRRVTVKYRVQHSEGEIVQRGVAEYKLLDRLLLNAFQDTRGVFGGGVTYRMEFR